MKPMQVARRSPGVVIYRSKLYVVGGMNATSDVKSVEVYDPIYKHWTKFPYPMKDSSGSFKSLTVGLILTYTVYVYSFKKNCRVFKYQTY